MQSNTYPKTLRVKQAAARYGVCAATLWVMAQRGQLHPVKFSPRITLWSVAELDTVFKVNDIGARAA